MILLQKYQKSSVVQEKQGGQHDKTDKNERNGIKNRGMDEKNTIKNKQRCCVRGLSSGYLISLLTRMCMNTVLSAGNIAVLL